MTKSALRILSVSAAALAALFAAGNAVNANDLQPAVAHYAQPQAGDYIRVAGLFGESDEEREARLQHEADQDGQISSLNGKVRDLEDTVRNLTGENEELQHRLSDLNAKIDRQQKDFEYRLCALSAQQLGASTGAGDSNAVPCPGSSTAPSASYAPSPSNTDAPPPQHPPQQAATEDGGRWSGGDGNGDGGDNAGTVHGKPPGVLGTLPAGSDNGPTPARGAARPILTTPMRNFRAP